MAPDFCFPQYFLLYSNFVSCSPDPAREKTIKKDMFFLVERLLDWLLLLVSKITVENKLIIIMQNHGWTADALLYVRAPI